MRRLEDGKPSTILPGSVGCDELHGLIAGSGMDNLGCSAQTETCDQKCSSLGTGRSSITTGPNYAVNYKKQGATEPLTDVAPSAEAWRKEKRPEKILQ